MRWVVLGEMMSCLCKLLSLLTSAARQLALCRTVTLALPAGRLDRGEKQKACSTSGPVRRLHNEALWALQGLSCDTSQRGVCDVDMAPQQTEVKQSIPGGAGKLWTLLSVKDVTWFCFFSQRIRRGARTLLQVPTITSESNLSRLNPWSPEANFLTVGAILTKPVYWSWPFSVQIKTRNMMDCRCGQLSLWL